MVDEAGTCHIRGTLLSHCRTTPHPVLRASLTIGSKLLKLLPGGAACCCFYDELSAVLLISGSTAAFLLKPNLRGLLRWLQLLATTASRVQGVTAM